MSKKLFVVISIAVVFFVLGGLTASAQSVGPQSSGPDLAANLRVQILSKSDEHNGRIRLIGSVKNVGTKTFQSKLDMQYVYLHIIDSTGKITKTRVDRKTLPVMKSTSKTASKLVQIKPGQESRVFTVDTDWNAAAVDREFPYSYQIKIVYGPDLDRDKYANDDRNVANNEKIISFKQINDIFYRTAFDEPSHGTAPVRK